MELHQIYKICKSPHIPHMWAVTGPNNCSAHLAPDSSQREGRRAVCCRERSGSTFQEAAELMLGASRNAARKCSVDSSAFQFPNQHVPQASFSKIIVCTPYEPKCQNHCPRGAGIFSMFSVKDKIAELRAATVDMQMPVSLTGNVRPLGMQTSGP